jgi:hypothetical protein
VHPLRAWQAVMSVAAEHAGAVPLQRGTEDHQHPIIRLHPPSVLALPHATVGVPPQLPASACHAHIKAPEHTEGSVMDGQGVGVPSHSPGDHTHEGTCRQISSVVAAAQVMSDGPLQYPPEVAYQIHPVRALQTLSS